MPAPRATLSKEAVTLAVVVVEQELRSAAERGQVAQLLDGPGDGGRHRGCGVDELSRFEVDDDKDIVTAEPEIADLDEVAGPDPCGLLTKEAGPTLAGGWRGAGLAQVPLDGSLGDGDAKLEEFASNALGAPQTVLDRHPANEVDDLGPEAQGARGFSPGAPLPYSRKPSQCQRRSVSGLTITRASECENIAARATSRARFEARNWGF
jgi:hypothetical protein